jgi:hypothetical protein
MLPEGFRESSQDVIASQIFLNNQAFSKKQKDSRQVFPETNSHSDKKERL